ERVAGNSSPATSTSDGAWQYFSFNTTAKSLTELDYTVGINMSNSAEFEVEILDENDSVINSKTRVGSTDINYMVSGLGD